ncbi:hypothetical protein [Persicitalea sp.]|uniref:hypothetical protein n=1 Tax=Persicitalea sp. TaxID=3100273 RepID=UPI003593F01C
MKNVKKMLAVALCSLMMFPTLAAHDTDCQQKKPQTFEVGMYRVKDSLKMRLMVEKKVGQKVIVRLLNQQGQVLHEEVVGKRMQKYGRNFDFSQIEDGRYTLEIANGEEVVQRSINLTTTDLIETPARTLVAMN